MLSIFHIFEVANVMNLAIVVIYSVLKHPLKYTRIHCFLYCEFFSFSSSFEYILGSVFMEEGNIQVVSLMLTGGKGYE